MHIHITLFFKTKRLLICYLDPDFEGDEKPKGVPLKIEIFLLRGFTKGLERVRSLLKPFSTFIQQEKIFNSGYLLTCKVPAKLGVMVKNWGLSFLGLQGPRASSPRKNLYGSIPMTYL